LDMMAECNMPRWAVWKRMGKPSKGGKAESLTTETKPALDRALR